MNRFLLLFIWLSIPYLLGAQNCGLEQSVAIPFSDTVKINLEVFDVLNDNLSAADQAVCSVDLGFTSNEVNALEMWLISPNQDTVKLIGPKTPGTGFGSLGARWDIKFLNDSINASASPDFPFDQYFDNTLNNFTANNYNGSYFPFQGSFRDFNAGPVNGTWQLVVHYDPSFLLVEGSQVFRVKINFCDARGYSCCFANAGSLSNLSDIDACAGSPQLQFPIVPEFNGMEADSAIYGYTFAIGKDSLLYVFDSLPDFSSYPPGTYQICGFSYQKDQRDSFPAIDGLLRLDTFANQLKRFFPPMCGQITDTCVTIQIRAVSDTTFLGNQLICGSDSLVIAGQKLDSTGLYHIQAVNSVGCDSIIQVNLSTRPIQRDTLLETACSGRTHISATGVELDTSGFYSFEYTSSITGCDSIIVINFQRLTVNANLLQSDSILTCETPSVTLDASGTTAFGVLSYQWEIPPFGEIVGTDSILVITEPGEYFLQLSSRVGNRSCADARIGPILITNSLERPTVDIVPPSPITCVDTIQVLQATITSPGNNHSFAWSSNNGNILSAADGPNPQVNRPGDYQLIVTNLDSGCQDTSFTQVALDTIRPLFRGADDNTLACDPGTLQLQVEAADNSSLYRYQWSAQSGAPIIDDNTATPTIDVADTYFVTATDLLNGCKSFDSLVIQLDTAAPVVQIAPVALLDCQLREVTLDASASDQSPSIVIDWQTSNGANIIMGNETLEPTVNSGGAYTLTLRDTLNGCSSQATIMVTDTAEALIAEITQSIDLSCLNLSTTLKPGNSSQGENITYLWTDLDNGLFSSVEQDSIIISQGGRYQLIVQNNFTKCLEVATYSTVVDTIPPVVNAGPDQELTCSQPNLNLDASNSDSGQNINYLWRGPCVLTDSTQNMINVNCEGTYTLTLLNDQNGCSNTDSVFVSTNPTTPRVVIADTFRLNCTSGQVSLDASQSSGGRVEWFFRGFPLGAVNNNIMVSNTGTYTVRIINDALGCSAEKNVEVILDCTPQIRLNTIDTLNCQNDSILLDASNTEGESLAYSWSGPAAACILGDPTEAVVFVNCPGLYQLIVENTKFNQSDTLRVEVIENRRIPIVDLGPDDTLTCIDPVLSLNAFNPANDTGLIYQWKTEFGLTFANTPNLDIESRGFYLLEVENPLNHCTSADTIFIQGRDEPVFEIKAPEIITCADSIIELSALLFSDSTNLVYNWSALDGQTIASPNSQQIFTDETGNFVLTISNLISGCSASDTIEVKRNQILPQVFAGEDQVLNCKVTQIDLVGSTATQGDDVEVRWLSSEAGNFLSNNEALAVTVADTGTYQLLVVDLENGCVATDTVQVLPPPPLPPLPSIPIQEITCNQPRLTLDVGFTTQDSFLFSWKGISDQGVEIPKQLGSSLTVDAAGFYTFELENIFTGCKDSIIARVDDKQIAPDFTIAVPEILTCQQTEVTLGLVFPIDTSRYDLEWQFQQQNARIAGDQILVSTPGQYFLTVTDRTNGCTQLDSILVLQTIETPTIILPEVPLLTCLNDTLIVDARGANNTVPVWSGPTGGIVGDSTQYNIAVRLPGVYVLTITDTLTGCTNGNVLVIDDNRIVPKLELDTSQFILGCDRPTLQIDAATATTASGMEPQFTWTGIDLSSTEASVSISLPQNLLLNILDPGNGCSLELNIPIRQDQELPQFQLSNDGPLGCGKTQSLLEAQFINFAPNFQLAWKDELGNVLGDQNTLNVADTGTYILVVTNPTNACSNEQLTQVGLNDQIPVIHLEADTSLDCEIDEVFISVSSANYQVSDLQLEWMTSEGQIIQTTSEGIRVGAAGIYQLLATHLSSNCQQTAEIPVIRNGQRITGADLIVSQDNCSETGSGGLFINQVQGGNAPFLYDFNESGLQSSKSINFSQAGIYRLQIQDLNGCEWDTLLNIEAPSLPNLDLGPDITLSEGDSINLIATLDASVFSQFNWINNNQVIASNTGTLNVKPLISTAYTVRASTTDGCTFEDVVQIFVEEAPFAYLPNAFSPDEDGINDLFFPGFSDQVSEIINFNIYDRWGNIIFQTSNKAPNDISAAWDGNLNNTPQPSAVYVFWIEVRLRTGAIKNLKGDVLLLR